MYKNVYPLAAIVGQEELKQGLILNAVNPRIGGMLIRGEKGTAKSTAVRGLAAVLPEIQVVRDCSFSCNPHLVHELCDECRRKAPDFEVTGRKVCIVNLPLNATEDRVVGGIDFSRTIKSGNCCLLPGLLATAHRGILYVDEVNLLDDHIVDIILDAAASGQNCLEREGISFSHSARFILIGTMNPEEGDLRPQLLDRFGLCVEVSGAESPDERVDLLVRRDEFDRDPAVFRRRFQAKSEFISKKIAQGRKILPKVRMARHLRSFITELCTENHVAGHRADLVMEQAARALAAFEEQTEVSMDHIRRVASMTLIHRLREARPPPPPLQEPPDEQPPQDEQASEHEEPQEQPDQQEHSAREQQPQDGQQAATGQPDESSEQKQDQARTEESGQHSEPEAGTEQIFQVDAAYKVKPLTTARDRVFRRGSGRRSSSRIFQKQGRYVGTRQQNKQNDIAFDATIRAAAPYQKERISPTGLAICLTPRDIREKIREKRIGNFLLFVVDASGSMGVRGRMAASKGAVMSLLLDAYRKRDKVAMITFRRNMAFINLPPTRSVELAGKFLAEMPVGGRTPLSAGLAKSYEQIRNYLSKEPTARPIVILITDGKNNVALGEQKPVEEAIRLGTVMARDERVKYIVVDTEEESLVTFGLARRLAVSLKAEYFKINDLQAEELVNIVRGRQQW